MLAAVLLCSCSRAAESPQRLSDTETREMETPAHVHHGIDYIEFTVTDMVEAKRFYGAAFDWKFNDYGPDYAGIQVGDGEVGGFRLDTEASTGGPPGLSKLGVAATPRTRISALGPVRLGRSQGIS